RSHWHTGALTFCFGRARALQVAGEPVTPGTVARLNHTLLARRLANVFLARGERLYLVGGSVRDQLLGRPTNDLDFATSATPDLTVEIIRSADPDSVYTVGEKFGTIGAVFGP